MYICEICGKTHYNNNSDYCNACLTFRSSKRNKTSDKTKANREVAKKLGGKALTGTAKQKAWAEQIRADFIKNTKLPESTVRECMTAYTDAKTWIENREKFASL